MRTLVTLLLLAATIAKVAAVLALGPASIEMDAKGYWQLSDLVVGGDVLMMSEPIAYRTPAYPWFLAIMQSCFGKSALLGLVVMQGAMWIATIWIAGKIAAEVTDSKWALPLTLLAALPTFSAITYSATVLTESLFTFLLMCNLWSVLIYLRKPSGARSGAVGISYGITVLTRPVVLYLWVAHLALIGFSRYRTNHQSSDRPGPRFTHIAIAALATAIIVSPWLFRNQRLFGSPFLTEFLGRNIWIVTFQGGSGAGLDLPTTDQAADVMRRLREARTEDHWRRTWMVSRALVATGLTDPEADQQMKQVALDAIKSDPGPFAYKTVRRTANFWRCAVTDLPVQGSENGQYQDQMIWRFDLKPIMWMIDNRLSRSVWFNTWVTTVIGIAVMILIHRRESRHFGIWIGLIFSYFAVVTGLVEIPNYRYRMVLEPLAAAAISSAVAMIAFDRHPNEIRNGTQR